MEDVVNEETDDEIEEQRCFFPVARRDLGTKLLLIGLGTSPPQRGYDVMIGMM